MENELNYDEDLSMYEEDLSMEDIMEYLDVEYIYDTDGNFKGIEILGDK